MIFFYFLTQLFSDEDITCMSNFNGGIYVLETIKSESSSLGSIDAISILILSSFSIFIPYNLKKKERGRKRHFCGGGKIWRKVNKEGLIRHFALYFTFHKYLLKYLENILCMFHKDLTCFINWGLYKRQLEKAKLGGKRLPNCKPFQKPEN